MKYSTKRKLAKIRRLIIKKEKGDDMELVQEIISKYYTHLGGGLYFRESSNKRTRILNFKAFKRTYETVGRQLSDNALKDVYSGLK